MPFILVLGVFVRILAFFNIAIINPDGILYIAQAKAIASGQWDVLTSFGLPYVSLYPFLIAFFHLFVPDWIVSGQLVSLTFGCGLLLLLYPLVRRFSSPLISRLTVLLFALTPMLVRYSVDVMRDSTYWFLYCASVVVLLASERYCNKKLPLFLGLIAAFALALLASWCRIEALLLLPAFFLYCLSLLKKERVRRASLLFVLLALLIGMGIVAVLPHHGDFFALVRLQEAAEKFYAPMKSYALLRSQLHTLASSYGFSLIGNFLYEAHHIAWSMPFAVILANACESFFYPFLPFYVLGF
ncbi:MAG: glycosyltransferase family 39 protein, partial [Desulfobulbus sp.]